MAGGTLLKSCAHLPWKSVQSQSSSERIPNILSKDQGTGRTTCKTTWPNVHAKIGKTENPKISASINARNHCLHHDDASKPTPSASITELRLSMTASAASFHPTPPIRTGSINTGNADSNKLSARTP